jgi:multidrug efflux pump subunit AcrA (membrane-fusion protein)
VVRVPSRALQVRDGQAYVRVVGAGRPEERAVQAGLSDGKYTEIVEGLQEGEQVAVAQIKTEKRAGGTNPFSTWGRPSSQKK